MAPGIRVANARTLADVDVFFTGWVPTDSYSAEEKEALREFVRGGGTVIATTDDSGHTMVDTFGVTQGDGSGSPTENTVTAPAHPIAAGLFGEVAGSASMTPPATTRISVPTRARSAATQTARPWR